MYRNTFQTQRFLFVEVIAKMCFEKVWGKMCVCVLHTVKPVYNDHPLNLKILAAVVNCDGCSSTGLQNGRFRGGCQD